MRARVSSARPSAPAKLDVAPNTRLKKRDKRDLKHAAIIHKVRDAGISKNSSSKMKRRRPSKRMEAAESLGGLRDALPDVSEDEDSEWEGLSDDDAMGEGVARAKGKKRRRRVEGEGKIKMKSFKMRPGAMKRKAVLERKEQERFGRNLARLVGSGQAGGGSGKSSNAAESAGGGDEGGGAGSGQAEKWAALRNFIGGTMEKDGAFGKG